MPVAVLLAHELKRFCQTGKNKGKPGPCPEDGAAATAPAARPKKKATVRGQLDSHAANTVASAAFKGLKVTSEHVKAAAAKVGQAAWSKLSPKAQQRVAWTYGKAKAIEHKAMIGFHKSREAVEHAAQTWGLSEGAASKLGKIIGGIDLALAWTVNVPAGAAIGTTLGGAAGGIVGAKVAAWTPVVSLSLLAASSALRAPFAAIGLARKLIGTRALAAAKTSEPISAGSIAGKVAERLSKLSDESGEWYLALLATAIDAGHAVGEAVGVADAVFKKNPTPDQKPKQAVHTECYRESNGTITDAEIFAAGTFRGKRYTTGDLDQMVRNFDAFSKTVGPDGKKRRVLLEVPAVLGHEETQEFLDRSDLPAAAWCASIRRKGKFLLADFRDVPPKVMRLLKTKRYSKVSAEVYDDPPEGIPGTGKMLRRVAFLGGDIPQIKDLDSIPMPEEHAEGVGQWRPTVLRFLKVHHKKTGTFEVFAEVAMPTRDEMIAKLRELGYSDEFCSGLKDEQLAECLRVHAGSKMDDLPDGGPSVFDGMGGGGGNSGDGSFDDPLMTGQGASAGKDRSSSTGPDVFPPPDDGVKLSDFADGELPNALSPEEQEKMVKVTKKMAERARAMAKKYGCKMGDDGQDASANPAVTGSNPMTNATTASNSPSQTQAMRDKGRVFSEADVRRMALEEVRRILKTEVQGSVKELQKFAEEEKQAKKRDAVIAFCESAYTAGKLTGIDYKCKKAGGPSGPVFARLLRADSRHVAHKYTEAKTNRVIELTEFDLQCREIERKPSHFGEKFASPLNGSMPTTDDGKKHALVERFRELEPGFKKSGYMMSEEDFVKTWMKAPPKEFDKIMGQVA